MMENGNNNATNTAKNKNHSKTLLYVLGIVGVVLLVGGGWLYFRSGKKVKAKDDATLIAKAKHLVSYGFLEKGCAEEIKAYKNARSRYKKANISRIRETYLKGKQDLKVTQQYQQSKDNILKVQQEIKTQAATYLMNALYNDLDNLRHLQKNYKRYDFQRDKTYTKEAREKIKNALYALGEANGATTYEARKSALAAAYRQLKECVTDGWWDRAYIFHKKHKKEAELVEAKIKEIKLIYDACPETGKIETAYNPTSLAQALTAWEDYKTLWQDYTVVTELEKTIEVEENTANDDLYNEDTNT